MQWRSQLKAILHDQNRKSQEKEAKSHSIRQSPFQESYSVKHIRSNNQYVQ